MLTWPGAPPPRVAILVTGVLAASFAPFWAGWLRRARPDLDPRWALTRGARELVSARALAGYAGSPVAQDPAELAGWADGWVVHPASPRFLEWAAGQAQLPGPVVVAPDAAPPAAQRRALAGRSGVAVLEPAGDGAPASLAAALDVLLGRLAGAPAPRAGLTASRARPPAPRPGSGSAHPAST